jgi:hypothetical protein
VRPKPQSAVSAPSESEITVPLDVSDPVLGQIKADQVEPLRRYLAASAGWRLTQIKGVPVAIRRELADETTPDAGKRRISPDGFYFKHQPWRRYRTLLRFGSAPLPVEPDWQAVLTPAAPGRADAFLRVHPANLPDYRSYLSLSASPAVTLEIMEESMDTGRETTRRLLRETNDELKKVLTGLPAVEKRGVLPGVYPAESVRSGSSTFKVESAHQTGAYHLYGYVNPGEAGYVYARALDSAGAVLSRVDAGLQTQEYVGWSQQPQQQFFFNSQLRLPAKSPAPARLELWFHPEQGPERKLLAAPVK